MELRGSASLRSIEVIGIMILALAASQSGFSTASLAERHPTARMSMRCLMQCINVFSNKFEKRSHAFASNFVFYNFCRINTTLGVTPAVASGLVEPVMKPLGS